MKCHIVVSKCLNCNVLNYINVGYQEYSYTLYCFMVDREVIIPTGFTSYSTLKSILQRIGFCDIGPNVAIALHRTRENVIALYDRGDTKQSKIIMTELSAKVKKNGWSVWIYPEAIDTKCPIIPIVVSNMSKFYNYEERRWLPGVLNVKCLDPIYTDSCTKEDVQLLVDKVRNNMQQCYSTIESELLEE
ncbi:hypothetical protein GJ496_008689 [Pomphorhynchus laevis]|nr:hypothetical protein GJ496_008689 [Pomphorhynchus laevis]